MKSSSQAVIETGACPLCQWPNHCQLCTSTAYKGPCWCMTTTIPDALLARVPEELRNKACICESCVRTFKIETTPAELPPHPARPPNEGTGGCKADEGCKADKRPALGAKQVAQQIKLFAQDFYFVAGGLMVFTEAYHLRRGHCCGSGCRHCPYPAAT